MSDGFAAGFTMRHEAGVELPPAGGGEGFAPADLRARANRARRPASASPRSFSPQPVGPRHFAPEADDAPDAWDTRSAEAGAFVDPIEKARAEAFAEGIAHARALAQADLERDAALLAKLGAALRSGDGLDRDALAARLRATVLTLVTRIVGEVGIAPELLATRVRAAADMLADGAQSAVLRLHPEDVALVRPHLPATIFPVADAAVARGGFALDSAATLVEDGPDAWLDQLHAALDRIALPTC